MTVDIDPAYYGTQKTGPDAYEKAGLVLITHGHRDHCDKRALSDICGPDTVIIGPRTCLNGLPGRTQPIKPPEEYVMEKVKVIAVEAYNMGIRGRLLHKKGECNGYLVNADGITIYHPGDTDLIPEMGRLGHVDIAMLPVAGMVTMSPATAVEAALLIKPTIVIPMHQLRSNPADFKRDLESKAPDITVVLLGVGESYSIF